MVVLMSLGSHGALLVTPSANQRFSAIPMRGGSGVGAGDAMVAAMLMTPGTAVCDRADIEKLFALSPEPCDVTLCD